MGTTVGTDPRNVHEEQARSQVAGGAEREREAQLSGGVMLYTNSDLLADPLESQT